MALPVLTRKFNHLDQKRIRSEQGRTKFYVFFAFFTCFYQFSTFLIIFSQFKTFFHVFTFFHFIFCFKTSYYFGGKHLKHNIVNQIVFLGEKLS